MAVSATELRPRGPVALVDAAVRLCARSSAVWAATLPGGAAVAFAALALARAISHHRPVGGAALGLALAWCFRGCCQIAGADQVLELLVSPEPRSVRASFGRTLAALPRAVITSGMLTAFNLFSLTFTLGMLSLGFASPIAGYATAARRAGAPLSVLAEAGRQLGPSRRTARGVRLLLLVFPLLPLNLHIAAAALLWIGQNLLGLDLSYAERFASGDNPIWVLAVSALGFALFEPLRAAVGALLLVDARVRREGLDLLARASSLSSASTAAKLAAALLLAPALLFAPAANAAPAPSAFVEQAHHFTATCGYDDGDFDAEIAQAESALERSGPAAQAEAARFVRYLNDQAQASVDDDDDDACDDLGESFDRGLRWIAAGGERAPDEAGPAQQRAKRILSRPEFAASERAAKAETEKDAPAPPTRWEQFWTWVKKWLESKARERPEERAERTSGQAGDGVGRALGLVLGGAALLGIAYVLVRLLRSRRDHEAEGQGHLEAGTAAALPEVPPELNALSRPPEGWAELADGFAARGDFREACRILYLAVLSRLHREGAIDYQPTASNWDHLRKFHGPSAQRGPFRELTLRFDFAVYGHFEPSDEGYREYRTLAAPILAASPTAEARVG